LRTQELACRRKIEEKNAMNKLTQLVVTPIMFCALTTTAVADFQFTFDGHVYEVVTSGLTWEDASTAAQNKTMNGAPGYLARIDSDEENNEIFSQISINIDQADYQNTSAPDGGGASYIWLGANDKETEGEWIWVDNGVQFWQGDSAGSAVGGLYNNWGQEPDDFNGQDAAGIALNDWPFGVAGQWNDVDTDNMLFYIIEYEPDLFIINAGHAGAWFNLETPGQGQLVDIETEGKFLFLSWFTFTDAASANPNEQHWFTAQGNYTGDTADLLVYETLGGRFDDPQEVSTDAVGSATLSFSDCGNGQLDYTIDSWNVQGSFPLERAIPGTENVCQERAGLSVEPLEPNEGRDGAWYDPASPGQGFLIDAHPDNEFIFVAWFTYGEDTLSGQRWLTAQGPLVGTSADLIIYETLGGSFDSPNPSETNAVGTMTIDDCSHALLDYSITDEALAGMIDIERAIPGTEALCEELTQQ
jgi:hypothetical protein